MRKTAGFLIVSLLTTLSIITFAAGDVIAKNKYNKTKAAGDVIAASCDDCHDISGDATHQAHLTASSGPLIASCGVCHDIKNFPDEHYPLQFSDGEDFANTTVCNSCHSPGGAYDGVNDPNIGAKSNWVSGVYDGSAFQAGKEKWCVTCHDDDPSVVNGVTAPNIAGDDTYYGYYKTGHGEHGNEQVVTCLNCHDPAVMHVDGEARTYSADTDNYQAGYRLKSVGGEAPLVIPRGRLATADQFRLCFSCHDSDPFLNWANTNTNFRADVNDSCETLDPTVYPPGGSDQKEKYVNKHYYHLPRITAANYDSDFDGVSPDSPISCPACHNVHGPRLKDDPGITHAPGMIRTGELIGRESEGAHNLEYFISQCPDTTTSSTNELAGSTGGSMIMTYRPDNYTRNGVCRMCHLEAEPYWREAKNTCGNCHASGSHVAHLLDEYGPQIDSCDVCHDMNNIPLFSDSEELANTTVCDPCHSPGGAYNGVDDPDVGAKPNWAAGVYNYDGAALQAGKEKWCVTCHDGGDPSINEGSEIDGVSAPNVAGDDASYGYYKTGHGKHGNEQAITCLKCHDPAFTHVDGDARTYSADTDNYQAGYRLKSAGGEAPMEVPRPRNVLTADQFRLCFSCHDSTPFLNFDNTDTNFRRDVDDSCVPKDPLLLSDRVNQHNYHLGARGGSPWDSDFDGVSLDSSISCSACHNVHGPRLKDGASHAPAMIRTGELIGRSSSLNLDYFTSDCPDRVISATNEAFDSTGGVMKFYGPGSGTVAKNGVCVMCHNEYSRYWRDAKDILSCGNCHDPEQPFNWHDFGWTTSYLADDNSGVGDGNDVETWADGQVGVGVGGVHLTSPGAAPSYDADGCPNSTPAVDFLDNEYLRNATLHCADANNRCTVVIIGRWSGMPSNGDTVFAGVGGPVRTEIYTDGSKWKYYAGGSAIRDTDTSVDTNFHAIIWDLDGTTGGTTPWTVDTDSENSDAGLNAPTNGITIGAHRWGKGFADFDYCAIGLYEGDATADGEWSNLQQYVCDTWGLDLGAICVPGLP